MRSSQVRLSQTRLMCLQVVCKHFLDECYSDIDAKVIVNTFTPAFRSLEFAIVGGTVLTVKQSRFKLHFALYSISICGQNTRPFLAIPIECEIPGTEFSLVPRPNCSKEC